MVEDQVVGASGALPTTTELISDHGDSPLSFTALSLKKYVSPFSRPVFSYRVDSIPFIVVVLSELSK